MLRLSPPGFDRLAQAHAFEVTYGGSEANVAATLAQFGMRSRFVTRLPENALGDAALAHLRRYGIDTKHVQRGGPRLGVYYLEHGASQRPSKVVYDRSGSAFSSMDPDSMDWDLMFREAGWFHFSGITPALSDRTRKLVEEACQAARRAKVTVSCDLNYRAKLWSTKEAQRVMRPLMSQIDLCIANEEDLWCCLGMSAAGSDVEAGRLDALGYMDLATQVVHELGVASVAVTLRESLSASLNRWSAIMVHHGRPVQTYRTKQYEIRIVDRVGAGDAFAGGLIFGLLNFNDRGKALDFAVAASCLAHTFRGDFNLATRAEVERLLQHGGSGRVVR